MRRIRQTELILSGMRAYFEYAIRQTPGPGVMFLRDWIREYEQMLSVEMQEACQRQRIEISQDYVKPEPEAPKRVIQVDNGANIEL